STYIRINDGENDADIITIYVNDLILLTKMVKRIDELKKKLSERFQMTDYGELHHFLGLTVNRDQQRHTLTLDQENYARGIITKFGMAEYKGVTTPLDPSV